MKHNFLHAYHVRFDWSGKMVLIKGEILNTTGMAWVVTSEKWKVPLIKAHFPNESKQIIP